MNAFKRKALTSAVLAGMSIAGAAHAVYQDPNGQGQALIYPYYTVQSVGGNAYNTYISVVNTTATVKVVKVRFREGKNSREVLDFNLYLSPNDVWTGALIPADATATSPGRLITADVSCTNPAIPAGGVDFRNFLYTGLNVDGAGLGLDRTREGYVEMIEMATVTGAPATAATHGASGSPTCTGLRGTNLLGVGGTFAAGANLAAPTGGLNGTGVLINVNNGADSGYNAVAFSNLTAASIYADIGNDAPNFSNADPTSAVIANNNSYFSDWTLSAFPGEYAVSATMMHSNVINEYVLDTATASNTDWVMTFPTKGLLVDTTAANPPFSAKFTASGACEPISFSYFNREERGATAADADFSPLPPTQTAGLCWESNIVSIRNGEGHMPTTAASGVLGSLNSTSISVTAGIQNGWANLAFTGANAVAGIAAPAGVTTAIATGAPVAGVQTYFGLPVVGFMVRSFANGTLTCGTASCQGNYGSAFGHKFIQTITP